MLAQNQMKEGKITSSSLFIWQANRSTSSYGENPLLRRDPGSGEAVLRLRLRAKNQRNNEHGEQRLDRKIPAQQVLPVRVPDDPNRTQDGAN